ncbi:hypothetical protein [Fulvivirga lutea]|uniref:DUF4369 domain-containing protein n=1 Tax=Fulvivirga lutea TaxID=2810512 RepID=A0A974WGC8_9BACT|nr:hypothetical protein [Fulvivirga lutea]QSE97133.1 hypothetical protein JR347_16300 [Fulvivirga lutea]
MISTKSILNTFFLVVGLLLTTSVFAQVDDPAASNTRFYYSGSLGSNEKIELNIQLTGYLISGSYMVINSGDIFLIRGRLSADKAGLGVIVYDSENNYVAAVEARVVSEELDFAREIRGVWKSPDGNLIKNLRLNKVAEFARNNAEESTTSYFE